MDNSKFRDWKIINCLLDLFFIQCNLGWLGIFRYQDLNLGFQLRKAIFFASVWIILVELSPTFPMWSDLKVGERSSRWIAELHVLAEKIKRCSNYGLKLTFTNASRVGSMIFYVVDECGTLIWTSDHYNRNRLESLFVLGVNGALNPSSLSCMVTLQTCFKPNVVQNDTSCLYGFFLQLCFSGLSLNKCSYSTAKSHQQNP